ncbi:MAG TPA: EAL domain-containing response regulator [Vitreimonas sp.]|nr:EAL domain-containing response regulator [Vitreimonas sp.]
MTAWRSKPRIIVVDDQEPNRRLLEQTLKRAGFADVRSYSSGGDFLEAFATDDPDLVLLDLHMPFLDGFEVLAGIRERQGAGGYLPVLVLTADVERSARSRALSGGANDFLVKPFDTEEVVLRVRNLLETRQLHQALRVRNSELVQEVAASSKHLAAQEAEWATVAAALSRLDALETPEATASAICSELARLPDIDMAAIVAFGAGGALVPLAREGRMSDRVVVNAPLPGAWSPRIGALVRKGPWVGSLKDLAAELALPDLLEEPATAAALIPFGPDRAPVGFLSAGTIRRDGIAAIARHVPALEAFAAVGGALLGTRIGERQRDEGSRASVRTVIDETAFHPVFQPIVELETGTPIGYEALTRFTDGVRPDRHFAEADAVGLGPDLEAACLAASLRAAVALPRDTWLSLNISPSLALDGSRLRAILSPARRDLVLELTEHVPVDDYDALRRSMTALGPSVHFAIDDAGAGFASFRHILELRPQFVKLDIGIVRGIESDPARQALVAGMRYFALKTGCRLIAEGIETEDERRQLSMLAVELGQGYLLGRPFDPRTATTQVVAGAAIPRRRPGKGAQRVHGTPAAAEQAS